VSSPVRCVDVRKTYVEGGEEVRALGGVSLEVAAGEMVALVGPSGCGKSTLLNLIGCVDLPTSGAVEVEGRATTRMSDDERTALRRTSVGTVFQFFNLLGNMTVSENVALPLVLAKRPRSEVEARVHDALEAVGIGDRAGSYPAQLSGGQMQRAAVARAVVHRPAIVLADEPTGNLDSQNGAAVLQLLRGLATAGQAILMATHSAAAARQCDRTITLADGLIVS
jgi:putative ABC transport system ATP-binding protein